MIILIGLQLLAQQYGWAWADRVNWWQLWPLFFILLGVSVMTRGRVWSAAVGTTIGLVVIAGGILLALQPVNRHEQTGTFNLAKQADSTAVNYTLGLGAGTFVVTGDAAAEQALGGTWSSDTSTISATSSADGAVQSIDVRQDSLRNMWFGSHRTNATIRLNPTLTKNVTFNGGAGNFTFDLQPVSLSELTINTGAASLAVNLGDVADRQTVTVSAGASSIHVTTPSTVGLRVKLETGVSSKNLASSLHSTGDNTYQTDGYGSAAKTIDLTIKAGASSITVDH